MRALFTLIKRQIVDSAVYFLAAIIFSIALIIAIISITFSEDITYLSLYTVILIITVPILFGTGSYILGLIQTYSDKTSGVTSVLSVLPVRRGQILIARFITGTLIILTLLAPLAITGAILWELLGPPDWLYHDWLSDTFIGLFLASLSFYCVGLIAARKAEIFASALRTLPLVLILMLLIVIKGFGWPLLAVLLPILAVLLLCCFKPDSNRFMTIIATAFTVLVLLAIPLYFGRNFCDGLLVRLIDTNATVSPSGLLPPEIENDPNVENHSKAVSDIDDWWRYDSIVGSLLRYNWASEILEEIFSILEPLGITEYFESLERGKWHEYSLSSHPLNWYAFNTMGPPIQNIHLDEKRGQLIYRRMITDTRDNRWRWKEVTKIYAEPKGVSAVPNSNLRYFESPIIHFFSSNVRPKSTYQCLVYDKHFRCFFDINFENKTVHRGPNLKDSASYPIDIDPLGKSDVLQIGLSPPSNKYGLPVRMATLASSRYLPIVDESGQIYLLDPNTLVLHGPAGFLPRPKTLFGQSSSKPRDLLDYDVEVMAIIPNRYPIQSQAKGKYLSLVAGSLSRQGMWTSVAVFDKDGKKIKSADSKSTFFNVPGGPAFTITKYIFESLHPPVLTLASFFTAYSFEARSTHRALFLMPNSFVAMARDYEGNIFYMFLLVLLLMLPGIMFAGLLGWRVWRDAAIIGLSHKAKRFWLAGTLIFGLPAYITYRHTRPKVTLVTCANCGKPRRPDMDKCHRCGSKWDVPELTPPTWRVILI